MRSKQERFDIMNILLVVDMQNDFITGSLGTQEAQAILPLVVNKVKNFKGKVLFTRDTHQADYLSTQEGRNLPVEHCIQNTPGWEIAEELDALRTTPAIDKVTFGSSDLVTVLQTLNEENPIASLTIVGLCTDICVISNALIAKAFFPELPITVDAACCAGVTPQSHKTALEAMKPCQIMIENG